MLQPTNLKDQGTSLCPAITQNLSNLAFEFPEACKPHHLAKIRFQSGITI